MQKRHNDTFITNIFIILEICCIFRNDTNEVVVKAKRVRILKYFILVVVLIFTLTDCASSKKNPYLTKKREASKVSSTQIGRNKYYFSSGYQKKLSKSYKKR